MKVEPKRNSEREREREKTGNFEFVGKRQQTQKFDHAILSLACVCAGAVCLFIYVTKREILINNNNNGKNDMKLSFGNIEQMGEQNIYIYICRMPAIIKKR